MTRRDPARWIRTVSLLALVWLAGCQPAPASSIAEHMQSLADLQPASLAAGDRLRVVATTTLVADAVRRVAGEDIDLTTLLQTGTDPHAYEPAPQDARALAQADVVFLNGFGLERFLEDRVLLAATTAPFVSLSEGIRPLRLGGGSGEEDPHVWLDPRNVVVWAENAGEALAKLDPIHAEAYRGRATEYRHELEALDQRLADRLDTIPPEARKLVTDHDTLGYFAARFGFTLVGAIVPSASSSADVSAREFAALEEAVRREGVRAVFNAAEVNPDLGRRLADDTGARFVPLYLESLTGPDGPAPTYVDLMEYDVKAIVQGLSP
ncbi:MAG TPA: zinc ABC transporter substrate-binding protein [Anaerolineales bacterium]|nr:zinc ABC transporter substrate-binding protein [Anaerolineales bacterium]